MKYNKGVLRIMAISGLVLALAGCDIAVTPSGTVIPTATPKAQEQVVDVSYITNENALNIDKVKNTLWQTSFEGEDSFLGTVTKQESIGEYKDMSVLDGDCVSLIDRQGIDATPIGASDGAIDHLFDASTSSKYIVLKNPTVTDPVYITLPLKKSVAVNWYSIISGNDAPARDPQSWALLGSNDGKSWETVHTVAGYTFPEREQTHVFRFENSTEYSFYKLEITVTGGDSYTQICGLRIGSGSGKVAAKSYVGTVSPSLPYKGSLSGACFDIALESEQVINRYSITSSAEQANSDPMYWTFYASKDGKSWSTLHTQDMTSFATRKHEYIVDISNTESYKYYRLRVDKAAVGNNLALEAITLYSIEHKPGEPTVSIGAGAGNVWGSVPLKGWTGDNALMFAGTHLGTGRAQSEVLLYDGLNVKIDKDTYLGYKILPDYVTEYDYEYTSQYMALDLVFTDGSRLSELAATDQYGFELTARGQGASKVLYTKTWNEVISNISSIAEGKTVKSILLIYDKPSNNNSGNSFFRSYFDDITLYSYTENITALVDHVDITRGTYPNTHVTAPTRGNGAPLVALPSGFNQFAPVNNLNTSRVYSYHLEGSAKKMYHLSMVHFPNAALGDYSEYSFMLNTSVARENLSYANLSAQKRGAEFSHENEISKPYYYSVTFDDNSAASNSRVEITPTMYGAKIRFSFADESQSRNIIFDCPRGNGSITFNNDGSFQGHTDMKQEGVYYGDSGARRMYFYGYADTKVQYVKSFGELGVMSFDSANTVTLSFASSFISLDQAKKNLELDGLDRSFEEIACQAKKAWESILARVRIEGASKDQLTTFYSNLYRMYLYPLTYHENVGTADAPRYAYANPYKGSKTKPEITSGKLYTGNVTWDIYRNVWQAYALLTPSRVGEYAQSLIEHYDQLGWTPKATVPKSIVCMNAGCDNIFADLAMKGIEFDYEAAYNALLKEVNCYNKDNLGRQGSDTYPYTNYIQLNLSANLEYALGDYSMSQFAALLGKDDEAQYFLNRSKAYANSLATVNGESWFVNGYAPGNNAWGDAFDPASWSLGYAECSAWHLFTYATHDIEGMISLYGGKKQLEEKLDKMFTSKNTINYSYDTTWAYLVEARECKMGKYNHGNQPGHSITYIYNYAGAPYKTQQYVREILSRLYCGSSMGGGYPGDDDTGEMSAWYFFSSLGFYPVELADNNYIIGSPLFDKVTITLENGKTLTITAHDNSSKNIYIQSMKVNGEDNNKFYLTHDMLTSGGSIEFFMGDAPSDWATAEDSAPGTCVTVSGELPEMQTDLLKNARVKYEGFSTPSKLVDDNNSTGNSKCSSGSGGLTVSFGSPAKVSFITLTCSADTAPSGFELLGSNDGESWVSIEKRTDLTFAWDLYLRSFKVNSDTAYKSYKLILTSESQFEVVEIELIGE